MSASEGQHLMKPAKVGNKAKFRAELIVVARRLFLERGIQATSMVDLGREMGVSKPTVYEVFDGKQELIEAVFDAAADDVDRMWILDEMRSPGPFPEFLDKLANAYKKLFRAPRQAELFMIVLSEGVHGSEVLSMFIERFVAPTVAARRKIVARAIERGECLEVPVEVAQRMLVAPLYYLLLDLSLHRGAGLTADEADIFIDQSFSALKYQLCGIASRTCKADADQGAVA